MIRPLTSLSVLDAGTAGDDEEEEELFITPPETPAWYGLTLRANAFLLTNCANSRPVRW